MGGSDKGCRPQIRVFEEHEELSTSLADYVAQLSENAVKERGLFALAISGSNILPKFLRKLSHGPYLKTVEWSKWHVFWANENVVPRKHPDCHYRQTKEAFLSKVPIPPAHTYPVNLNLSGERAAEDYQFAIRQHVRNRTVGVSPSTDCPRFDLVLLLMGSDGHVASLLPNHPVLEDTNNWIALVSDLSEPPYERVTFTLPVINSAANVAIIATGPSSANVLSVVFGGGGASSGSGNAPVEMISLDNGELTWFVDRPAVSLVGDS